MHVSLGLVGVDNYGETAHYELLQMIVIWLLSYWPVGGENGKPFSISQR